MIKLYCILELQDYLTVEMKHCRHLYSIIPKKQKIISMHFSNRITEKILPIHDKVFINEDQKKLLGSLYCIVYV